MKKLVPITLISILFLLSSCAPKIITSITKNYAALDSTQEVKVIELTEEVPLQSELLGEVKIGDSGFTNKCDLPTVLAAAKLEARKVGGNAIKITSHHIPDYASSCHRISANIYKVSSFNLAATHNADTISSPSAALVNDSIQITKISSGYKFMYKGENLSMDRLGVLSNKNATSAKYYSQAKGTSGLLLVMSYVGGGLIGYPIGTFLGGGKPYWNLAIAGCGILVISLPIISSVNNNLLKAANAYNEASKISRNDNFYDVKLGLSPSGLALIVKF
ncbi:MAG: hypothetical protein WCJ61_10250 [Paludibacter sp.]